MLAIKLAAYCLLKFLVYLQVHVDSAVRLCWCQPGYWSKLALRHKLRWLDSGCEYSWGERKVNWHFCLYVRIVDHTFDLLEPYSPTVRSRDARVSALLRKTQNAKDFQDIPLTLCRWCSWSIHQVYTCAGRGWSSSLCSIRRLKEECVWGNTNIYL